MHWVWLLMHQRGWHLVLYKERTTIAAAQERRRSSLPQRLCCNAAASQTEEKIIIRNSKWHSKGRKTATDIAVSSGTAELQMTKRNKMQPVVYPQCRPLLLDSRSNPADPCSSSADRRLSQFSKPGYIRNITYLRFCSCV